MLVVGSYETHHPDGEILDAENIIFIIELDVQVRGCRGDTLPAAAGKGASAAKLLVYLVGQEDAAETTRLGRGGKWGHF